MRPIQRTPAFPPGLEGLRIEPGLKPKAQPTAPQVGRDVGNVAWRELVRATSAIEPFGTWPVGAYGAAEVRQHGAQLLRCGPQDQLHGDCSDRWLTHSHHHCREAHGVSLQNDAKSSFAVSYPDLAVISHIDYDHIGGAALPTDHRYSRPGASSSCMTVNRHSSIPTSRSDLSSRATPFNKHMAPHGAICTSSHHVGHQENATSPANKSGSTPAPTRGSVWHKYGERVGFRGRKTACRRCLLVAVKHRPPDICGRTPLNSTFRSPGLELPACVVLLPVDPRPRTPASDPQQSLVSTKC